MTDWAPLQVGRLTLAERPGGRLDDVFNAGTGVRTAAWEGQESAPPLTLPQIVARRSDLVGSMARLVPVVFGEKTDLNGYYIIDDANTALERWGDEVVRVNWQVRAKYRGSDTEVDLESQLSGAQTRVNAHSITGERWHAPPPGAYAYGLPTGTPTLLTVTGEEGPLTVYRGIPVGQNPRWGCAVEDYGGYRARFLDGAGSERTGNMVSTVLPGIAGNGATGWTVTNGLVRVQWTGNRLVVGSHNGTAWADKQYVATVASSELGAPESCATIRNDYECVTIRLLWGRNPGRTQLDLTVRRGARWVETMLRTQPSTTIVWALGTPETTTSATGYITATGDDAAGRRFLLASAGAFTPNTGASSITRASTTAMDALVGATVGAGATGDQASNHLARYLGVAAEVTQAVRR